MKQVSSIIFKKITKDRFRDCALLRHQLWPQNTQEAHFDDITTLFANPDHSGFLAYDSAPVGFIEMALKPYVNGCLYRPVGFIEGIYILPAYHGTGLEATLISLCEEWAQERGAKEIASDAYLENSKAHDDFVSWGFSATEKIVYFRKKL